jgi:hypothetical protein
MAWSIVIVATPGLADRFVSNPGAASATAALPDDRPSDANRPARVERISDLRTDCLSGETPVDIAGRYGFAAQPMPEIFVPDRRASNAASGDAGVREASFVGLCR